ncbi:MAG: hypothetical protein JXR25_09080 [Pontiellaceae bacterium]|nr:hypothetical protein [Pontiellaceae bacterium]MBN2784969.1 hypothetical protein [Pontiellaceae bacterium]
MTNTRVVCAAMAALGVISSWAATPTGLKDLMDAGEPVTVIDIRPEGFYQSGHIPNAINIPARVLALKKLPPLGRVVVYDSGLGTEKINQAVQLLNEKSGIQAEALEGGYAAWEMARGSTTQPIGFTAEKPAYISYQDLTQLDAADAVLVDLRTAPEPEEGKLTRQGEPAAPEPLTSLSEVFPGRSVVTSPFDVSGVVNRPETGEGGLGRMADPPPVPVMILIDNGDGAAEKTARILKANGIKRVVILAGGEEILKRRGAPGLMRMGMGAETVEVDDE